MTTPLTTQPTSPSGSADRSVLLIGDGKLADATQRAIQAAGGSVARLPDPSDEDIRRALEEQVDSVLIVSGDDHVSLRFALVIETVCPGFR